MGFVRVHPDRRGDQGKNLFAQQLIAHILLILGRADPLGGQHTRVGFGIEAALGILEGFDPSHGLAQFQRRHTDARARGLLGQQGLLDQIAQHLAAQMLLLELLAGNAGIIAQDRFLRIAVGLLKLLDQNGIAVDDGHHIGGVPVVETAHSPEHEDQDDDAESHFDAERLCVGTDIIEHAYSGMPNCPLARGEGRQKQGR